MPKVSIVTPFYNHARFAARRVESFLSQSMQDWEWIVIDDCSTDESYEIVHSLTRHDARVKLTRNERNLGLGPTTTAGLRQAQGQYIYRADSDDYTHPEFFAFATSLMDRDEALALIHGRTLRLDEHDVAWGGWPRKPDARQTGLEALRQNVVQYQMNAASILFRNDLMQQIGGYEELPLRRNGDWYLSLRLCLLGDVQYYGRPLTYHREHSHNVSGSRLGQTDAAQMEIELFGVIDDVLNRVSLEQMPDREEVRSRAYRRAAGSMWRSADWAMANGYHERAAALRECIAKYVPGFSPAPPASRGGVKQRVTSLGYDVVTRATRRKLPPMSAR